MIKKRLLVFVFLCLTSILSAMNYLMLPGEWGTLNDMENSFYIAVNPNVCLMEFRGGKTKQFIADYLVNSSFLLDQTILNPFNLAITMFDYPHSMGYAFTHYIKKFYINRDSYFNAQVFSLSLGKKVHQFGVSGRIDYFRNKPPNFFQQSSSFRLSMGFIGFADNIIYSLFYTSSMPLNFENSSYLAIGALPSLWSFDLYYAPSQYLYFNQSISYIQPTYSTAFSTEKTKIYEQELRWKLSVVFKEKLFLKSKFFNVNHIQLGFGNMSNNNAFSFFLSAQDSIYFGGGFDVIVLPFNITISLWGGTTTLFDDSDYSSLSLKMEFSL